MICLTPPAQIRADADRRERLLYQIPSGKAILGIWLGHARAGHPSSRPRCVFRLAGASVSGCDGTCNPAVAKDEDPLFVMGDSQV